jgi:hypothetical protein
MGDSGERWRPAGGLQIAVSDLPARRRRSSRFVRVRILRTLFRALPPEPPSNADLQIGQSPRLAARADREISATVHGKGGVTH